MKIAFADTYLSAFQQANEQKVKQRIFLWKMIVIEIDLRPIEKQKKIKRLEIKWIFHISW